MLLLAAFVVAALFGAATSLAKDEHGQALGCSFMQGHVSWCAGSPLNHLASWQAAFSSILPLLIVAMALLSAAGAAALLSKQKPSAASRAIASVVSIVPSSLAFAFSNGILHPKLYA